uniref:Uncharacterized protein n=1 Tax=Noccaea caerulescens TaxID=107243 RepID=A0A1J3E7S1_NOCCA
MILHRRKQAKSEKRLMPNKKKPQNHVLFDYSLSATRLNNYNILFRLEFWLKRVGGVGGDQGFIPPNPSWGY